MRKGSIMQWVNAFEGRPVVDIPHPVAGSCSTSTNRGVATGDEWDRSSRVIGGWVLRRVAVHVGLRELPTPICSKPHKTNKEVAVTATSRDKLARKVQRTRHGIYAMVLA